MLRVLRIPVVRWRASRRRQTVVTGAELSAAINTCRRRISRLIRDGLARTVARRNDQGTCPTVLSNKVPRTASAAPYRGTIGATGLQICNVRAGETLRTAGQNRVNETITPINAAGPYKRHLYVVVVGRIRSDGEARVGE